MVMLVVTYLLVCNFCSKSDIPRIKTWFAIGSREVMSSIAPRDLVGEGWAITSDRGLMCEDCYKRIYPAQQGRCHVPDFYLVLPLRPFKSVKFSTMDGPSPGEIQVAARGNFDDVMQWQRDLLKILQASVDSWDRKVPS